MNASLLIVVVTETPQVETQVVPNPLCVCRIKEVAVLSSLNRRGLGLVVKIWDISQLMLKVIWSLVLSWALVSPLPCAAQGCPRPGETWHAPQQRDDETSGF